MKKLFITLLFIAAASGLVAEDFYGNYFDSRLSASDNVSMLMEKGFSIQKTDTKYIFTKGDTEVTVDYDNNNNPVYELVIFSTLLDYKYLMDSVLTIAHNKIKYLKEILVDQNTSFTFYYDNSILMYTINPIEADSYRLGVLTIYKYDN